MFTPPIFLALWPLFLLSALLFSRLCPLVLVPSRPLAIFPLIILLSCSFALPLFLLAVLPAFPLLPCYVPYFFTDPANHAGVGLCKGTRLCFVYKPSDVYSIAPRVSSRSETPLYCLLHVPPAVHLACCLPLVSSCSLSRCDHLTLMIGIFLPPFTITTTAIPRWKRLAR